jgi:TPP-dependent pyruvate/acetoin dehydrogenase alpha subunit
MLLNQINNTRILIHIIFLNNFMNSKIKYQIYINLSLVRKIQEELIDRYHLADQMRCPMHFCIGQELMPAVLGTLIIKEDSIFTHHGSHGYYIAKKGSINEMIAEIMATVAELNIKLDAAPQRICWPNSHVQMSTPLEKDFYFDENNTVNACNKILNI